MSASAHSPSSACFACDPTSESWGGKIEAEGIELTEQEQFFFKGVAHVLLSRIVPPRTCVCAQLCPRHAGIAHGLLASASVMAAEAMAAGITDNAERAIPHVEPN